MWLRHLWHSWSLFFSYSLQTWYVRRRYGHTWYMVRVLPNFNMCIFSFIYAFPNKHSCVAITVWCLDSFFLLDFKIFWCIYLLDQDLSWDWISVCSSLIQPFFGRFQWGFERGGGIFRTSAFLTILVRSIHLLSIFCSVCIVLRPKTDVYLQKCWFHLLYILTVGRRTYYWHQLNYYQMGVTA